MERYKLPWIFFWTFIAFLSNQRGWALVIFLVGMLWLVLTDKEDDYE